MLKNMFCEKLAANSFFGKIVKAQWVSSIQLNKTRQTEIQSCFDCNLSFHYPQTLKTFFDNTNSIDSTDNNSSVENK